MNEKILNAGLLYISLKGFPKARKHISNLLTLEEAFKVALSVTLAEKLTEYVKAAGSSQNE